MRVFLSLLLVGFVCVFFVSCAEKKSADVLSVELVVELEKLPRVLESVHDEASARVAVESLVQMRAALAAIVSELPEGEVLTEKQQAAVGSRIRAVQGESNFLLQKLAAQPGLVVMLEGPMIEVTHVLSVASDRMKGQ